MVTVVEVVQPPLSVIVMVYVPAVSPLTVSGVEMFVVVEMVPVPLAHT